MNEQMKAYQMGIDAFKAGKDYDDCPFDESFDLYSEWMDGFEDAGMDSEVLMAETIRKFEE